MVPENASIHKYFVKKEAINAGKKYQKLVKRYQKNIFLCENTSHSLCFGNNWNDALIIKVITNTSWSPKQSAVRFMKRKKQTFYAHTFFVSNI